MARLNWFVFAALLGLALLTVVVRPLAGEREADPPAAGSSMTLRPTTPAPGDAPRPLLIQPPPPVPALSGDTEHAKTATAAPIDSGFSRGALLTAVVYDGYELGDADEAVAVRNCGSGVLSVAGWSITDGGASRTTVPPGTSLDPDQTIWLARNGEAFRRQHGFAPDFEASESSETIPNTPGAWPGFANDGDEVILQDTAGNSVDILVYEDGDASITGWSGPALRPLRSGSQFASEGQVLYRRLDRITGRPLPDTNKASDWAQYNAETEIPGLVRYPGWNLEAFFQQAEAVAPAPLTIGVSPDNAYAMLASALLSATNAIVAETLTIENVALGDMLAQAAARGVAVTLLLEGDPPGGLPPSELYICARLEAAGGRCWFMVNEPDLRIFDRYRFLHAKFMVVDGARVIVSSENFSPDSLPDDDKSDGTWGRRGLLVATDAPAVVARLLQVFADDLDSANHIDLARWRADDPVYGRPPAGYIPDPGPARTTYTVRYEGPLSLAAVPAITVYQSPENALRPGDGLLGLIAGAGAGDTVLVQQLSEPPYWGASEPVEDRRPNPRLEAYIDAAARGATVRLLLDSFFDDPARPASNSETCTYVNGQARDRNLDLRCALANPTGLGIHNKMVLASIDGQGTVHVGSLNGTELSNKGNREIGLQVQSDAAYQFLAAMFTGDWPWRAYLPLALADYKGPADHLLISEFLYDPPGLDDAEFIELVNPTGATIDLSGYGLGDAVLPDDFEDRRRFPQGTRLTGGGLLVVASAATAFESQYGFKPDFEIVATDVAVPDLIDDPSWGDPAALLRLGNSGDEVILTDAAGRLIDVVVYGDGYFPGHDRCDLPALDHSSLERFPYWRDTDHCPDDFRFWPFPGPGRLPD